MMDAGGAGMQDVLGEKWGIVTSKEKVGCRILTPGTTAAVV